MRVYNQGCFIRVTVSRREVGEFASRWPCSDLPDSGVSFTFDRKTGDLVDLSPQSIDGEALAALSQDAQAYAEKKGE